MEAHARPRRFPYLKAEMEKPTVPNFRVGAECRNSSEAEVLIDQLIKTPYLLVQCTPITAKVLLLKNEIEAAKVQALRFAVFWSSGDFRRRRSKRREKELKNRRQRAHQASSTVLSPIEIH